MPENKVEEKTEERTVSLNVEGMLDELVSEIATLKKQVAWLRAENRALYLELEDGQAKELEEEI